MAPSYRFIVLLVLLHFTTCLAQNDINVRPLVLPTTTADIEDNLVTKTPSALEELVSPTPTLEDDVVTPTPDIANDDSPLITTSPTTNGDLFVAECLNDSECADDEYCFSVSFGRTCFATACDIPPPSCKKRLNLNAPCNETRQCGSGTFCEQGPDIIPSCKKLIEKGGECLLIAESGCAPGLQCVSGKNSGNPGKFGIEKGICAEEGVRGAGESCSIGACASGLFCQLGEITGVCVKKKGDGESCRGFMLEECGEGFYCDTSKVSPNFLGTCKKKAAIGQACSSLVTGVCAEGFCQQDVVSGESGVCLNFTGVGGACRFENDCVDPSKLPTGFRTPSIVCNKQKNPLYGICYNETNLIKSLGAPCDPEADACDSRRNFVCEEFGGKNVCVQRWNLGGGGLKCTPGSPLSSCEGDTSSERECRRALSINEKAPYGESECLPKLQQTEQGQICNKEDYQVCADGLSCEIGPGVGLRDPFPRDIPLPVRYCMKKVPAEGNCSMQFETFCEVGSACVDGVCKLGAEKVDAPKTMAGFLDGCDDMPCAPGLVCTENPVGNAKKTCDVPVLTLRAGEDCTLNGTVAKKCGDGLLCKQTPGSKGLACGPKAKESEPCSLGDCAEDLVCIIDNIRLTATGTCMKLGGTGLGGSCDPSDKGSCGSIADTSGPPGGARIPLRCLGKGGSFACQQEKGLFGKCSESSNEACAVGLLCDSGNSTCVVASR